MDLGGLDRLLCSQNTNSNNSVISAFDLDPKPKSCRFKQEPSLSVSVSDSVSAQNQDQWREMKMPKISQDDFPKGMLLHPLRSNTCSAYSDSQNMLSFSSPNTHWNTGYGVRGVFTPSQWMELKHQALIYKYITVNAPVPSNLLIPIRKALETAPFCSFAGTNLRHTAYGWSGFHMGFSNNSDPEPGRCRRTDGKKWRCSRDAVVDQKYCERHMNRGRHRSRKPVEGHTGHSVTNGPTTTIAAKVSAPAAPASTVIRHLQHKHQVNRSFLNKGNTKIQDSADNSMLSPSSIGVNGSNSVSSEFGFVCSDSLLNPLQKTDNGGQKSLHQFMDDWTHPDRTQLSISIPMSSSDLMSSNSSPITERLKFSPLRMGLGVGNTNSNTNPFDVRSQAANWIPVSWDASSGGPLGEVLNHNTNTSPSALNLMTDGWESSQHATLSPTGVLQKTGFGCFSNSSAGSSPRTDNSLLGSTTLITSSLPLL
ncbi:hypothetical protein R6Q57_017998 [Mikania cordata]